MHRAWQSTNFYPRPPRGGRRRQGPLPPSTDPISIHALREEGDASSGRPAKTTAYFYPRPPRGGRPAQLKKRQTVREFLSTPSARRATWCVLCSRRCGEISIHALREEGDPPSSKSGRPSANFYPRPPRGGRPAQVTGKGLCVLFLSTPSARRATAGALNLVSHDLISIHALREEGDQPSPDASRTPRNFYPRPPRGGRPVVGVVLAFVDGISIHALREEGDQESRRQSRPE